MTVLFSSLPQSFKAVQTQASLPLLEASNKVTHYWLFYQICWRCVCVCLFNWPGLASPLLKPLLLKTRCSVIMNPAEGSNRQSPTHIYMHKHAHTHIAATCCNDLEHYCSRCVSQIYTLFYWGGVHHSSFPLGAIVM